MKVIALVMLVSGAAIGTGGALEFAYFGPGTPQFLAGLAATPAGALAVAGGATLWRRGRGARRFVAAAAMALLCGTAIATALDVMGPPATLLGTIGAVPALVWSWKNRRVHSGKDRDPHAYGG